MLDEVDPIHRAAAAAALGQRRRLSAAESDALRDAVAHDPDERVRGAAVAALARAGASRRATDAWYRATGDEHASVRRRAAEVAPLLAGRARGAAIVSPLVALLADGEVTVVDAAAWALGELGTEAVRDGAVPALVAVATTHDDLLGREAAVAALGALGDPDGLPAILAACRDKPTVRRRAVLALAPFDGPEVTAALERALQDRDWQVRQAAEDLLGVDAGDDDREGA